MHSFKDAQGRAWNVRLTVADAERLASAKLGFDLYDVSADGLQVFSRLPDDYLLMGKCLWVLVERQAKAAKVSRDEFLEELHGEILGEAMAAWLEALWDFFPNPRRDELRRLAGELEAAKVLDLVEARISEKKSEGSSGKSPAPSASTLDPSPSVS